MSISAGACSSPGAGEVAAVVVTYHPGPEVEENIRVMADQCRRVVIVDNGSPPNGYTKLAAIPGVVFLPLGRNLGLAAALNHGIARALAMGCEWVVTFDQDSKPAEGMVAALWARHRQLPAAAVIGPRIEEAGVEGSSYRWVRKHPILPFLFQRARDECALADVTLVVTSGSLLDLAAWRQLGGFDEGLFIDYIDIDYCLRVIRAGRTVAVAGGAVLHHRLGARQKRVFLGRDFRPMHHAPFRHFYMARNRVTVWRRHALAVPHWAAFDFCFAVYNLARVLLFEDRRWAKLRAVVRGTWHGLLGRTGAMPP